MNQKIRESALYLIASPSKHSELSFRITMRPPALAADEIAMRVCVKLPDAIFRKPMLEATVEVPMDAVTPPSLDATVLDNVREELTRRLGIDMTIAVVESPLKDPG